MRMSRRLTRTVQALTCAAALVAGGSLVLNADVGADAALQLQLGTLLYDFPAVPERLGITLPPSPDPWGSKIALDLGHVQTAADVLVSPSLRIVSPKVE